MIPDVRIQFEFNDDERLLTFVEVPLAAWSELRRTVDMTPKGLMAGLEDGSDVDAMVAIVWLERVAAGHNPPKFVTFRDSLDPSDVLTISAVRVGPNVLFGEFAGDDDGPPTSGTE